MTQFRTKGLEKKKQEGVISEQVTTISTPSAQLRHGQHVHAVAQATSTGDMPIHCLVYNEYDSIHCRLPSLQ